MSPLYAGFSATNGLRACTGEHAVENIAADGNLRLLGSKAAGPQTAADLSLVAPDSRFDQARFP